ncbi:MAG: preprotein translocase subunit SecY [Archaeoglobi archaeon]|nr:preprotein translocase subunit SecY [Archaeoglobi archaeon]MDK2780998.1 preprotein translocase subunit SecY [Archaeoglobi archaeon]
MEESTKAKIIDILSIFPSVKRPEGHVHFREKIKWTGAILLLYFILSNVPVFGLSEESLDLFEMYRAFFAGASGSIILLGIGPIVTASIVLQLLVGAKIIPLDLSNPQDQRLFQLTQKWLVVVMIILETLPQIWGGYLKPNPEVASALGISLSTLTFIIFLQVFIGGLLIMFMDEVVSKWGIGSGVGLFIIAGISQALITGFFNWKTDSYGIPIGLLPKWVYLARTLGASYLLSAHGLFFLLIQGGLLALISTILIILLVVYVESVRVEIPIAHSMVRGARGKFPVKLVYASVLPMILVRALQANIQMFGMILYHRGIEIFGRFEGTKAVSGIMYYLSPIRGPSDWIPSLVRAQEYYAHLQDWQIYLHLLTDIFILIAGGIVFAIFWVETANMGPDAVARQIKRSGLQIPGFRRDVGAIERVTRRYIPKVTVLGGFIIGLLTAISSLLGTVGNTTGTGLLLTVSIAYRLYEQIASEQVMEMYPFLRRFLGKE